MALVSHELNRHLATITDVHLTWLLKIVESYSGPNPKSGIISEITGYRSVPERERRQTLAALRDPRVGVGLLKYSLPFIASHHSDVSLYPVTFQSAMIRIQDQLDMFHQQVSKLQDLHEKTFDASLTSSNRSIVISELEKGNRHLADQGIFIVDAISALPTEK